METQVADSLLGTLVGGRYRVRGRLTRGATAAVYAAIDERLERPVALKIAQPAAGAVDPAVGRFVDDAQAIARLTHPNLVATYDQGTHQGLPYLVMENVQGRTLREILASRRQLSPTEALAITEQVLAGLAAAHRAGLVHGDIRPEKILVVESPSGGASNLVDAVAKVADFGFPQTLPSGPGDGEDWTAAARYAAPELVADGRADPRGDVYSTGITLFEMLTGRAPYDTGTPAEIAWQHVDRTVPPPSRYADALPAAVDSLVARATRREPGARPSDAGALFAEIQAVRQQVAAGTGRSAPADSTVVMAAVPATDRPAWARLPAAGAGRGAPGGTRAGSTYPGGASDRRPPADPAAAARRRTLLLAVGVAVGLLLLAGGWWLGFGRWVPAPDLLGLPEQDAVAQAEQRGLQVAFDDPRHSDHVGAGLVLAQDPEGRVTRGGTLTLTVSLGAEVVAVPNVIGVEAEVAKRQLEALGLVVRDGEAGFSNTVPAGRVLLVEPGVGTELRPGEEVVMAVSRGRAPVEVPHLIGRHVNEASNELTSRGLQADVVEVESERPAGEVIDQDPGAGAGLEPGDTVRLEISDGPSTVPVPDVNGERCSRAERTLQEAGFQVFRLGGGRVAFQNPSPGTGLPPGSEVQIICG